MEVPERSNSWLVWHEELGRLVARLRDVWNCGCTADRHGDSTPPTPGTLDDKWPGAS
jgi:hypothetical protein